MDKISLKALAKINLGLDVVRRREDGYHEVRMVMQTIHLFDRLNIEKTKDAGISIKTNLFFLPVNENNLIYKAGKLLMDEFNITEGVSVELDKRIPVAAGMAGGSTDAAATMIAMNELFELGQTKEQLMELALSLGADIPFCIMGGTALAEGIGEKLTPLPAPPQAYVLIAKPPVMVPTKSVYESLQSYKQGKHPDIDGMVTALNEGSLTGITDRMENVLETVTIIRYPVIEEIKQFMKEHGAENALMSGSGPTVFGIYTKKEDAEAAAGELAKKKIAKEIKVTEFYN